MILTSSNKNKIKEFKEILPNLEIQLGRDLPEVLGTMDEVIIHKSLDAGKNYVVEDTILTINGKEVVDIKWNQDSLTIGDRVSWIVSLGYNNGKTIAIYRGIINGVIVQERLGLNNFGFNPYFLPDGSDLTLSQLLYPHDFSARKLALDNLNDKSFFCSYLIKDIKPWTGKYQNS